MSNLKIELNHAGIREMLRSEEAREICEAEARKAQGKLGEDYYASSFVGKERCNASVLALSKKAKVDNMKNNTILKALGGK